MATSTKFTRKATALALGTFLISSLHVTGFSDNSGRITRRMTRLVGSAVSDRSTRVSKKKHRSEVLEKHSASDTEKNLQLSRSSFLSFATGSLLAISFSNPQPAKSATTTSFERRIEKGRDDAASTTRQGSMLYSNNEIISANAKNSETIKESISGFLSGAALSAAKTVVKYPLDTATVRLQMPGTAYSISNLPALFEGSFRGITAPLLSNIPAGAVFFAVKDAAKAALKEGGTSKFLATSLAVAAALPPYWLIRNPSEVVKTRQQAGVDGYGEGTSIIDAFKLALSNNATDGVSGVAELYTGYWENLLYGLPADLIKFICYDGLTGGKKNLPPAEGAVYGAFSTAVAQLITTPLDVVRNRVMAGEDPNQRGRKESAGARKKLSYVESFRAIAQEEGIEALFTGATPRVGKAILSGAIQFATYEETKQSINKLLQKKV